MAKYRVRFAKEKAVRYLSHLDVIKAVERAVRRAGLQMVYSEGFHPHPKLSFGPALAVGICSVDEYFDIELVNDYETDSLINLLNRALPGGLRILQVRKIEAHHVKPLNAIINRASYLVELRNPDGNAPKIASELDDLMKQTELMVTRTNKDGQKTVNIRPWLHKLSTEDNDNRITMLRMVGEIGSGGHLRPEDVVKLLEEPHEVLNVIRNGMWHEEKGQVIKPMDFCDRTGGV